ncbi:RNA 2',3'-cyclic phosphodiesterase [Bacillus sp. SD088]|uniref:RNA 2',3'-cyclic phosphodiesterase n=1 Tax=Bacillus sp. SD088 TaxID=2782012 RepID=UPI001A96C940|nr:RNA 2',3'-cyclic phosphodiesterase [Bacillus sp. SD088]MBO0992431.1 RNA 2',3'-cyclic phosphodiesterase [Bacillus sp. SD088]
MMAEHYFFALALPDPMKEELAILSKKLKIAFPFKKWVHPADYHITLAFLGAADKGKRERAIGDIEKNLFEFRAFSLEITHLDTFGQRIFWAGVNNSKNLLDVQKQIYTSCQNAGFSLEERRFHPHITLARKWPGEQRLKKEMFSVYDPSLSFLANEVVLYRTHPEKTPKYEKVKTFSLSHS